MVDDPELNARWRAALNTYLQRIKDDYVNWQSSYWKSADEKRIQFLKSQVAEFNSKLRYEVGTKFIKVIQNNSVHSFIVLDTVTYKNGVTFKAGDILKPAGWKSPAINKARGNIFDTYVIRWTGPIYLR